MPSAQAITEKMTLMGQAAGANFVDEFRRGSEVVLPPTGDLMIVGDLHGHMENFHKAVAIADLDNHPERHLILQEVIHQLAIGEDHSYEVLEAVAELKLRHPHRVHVILGNHDLAEWQGREIFKGGLCLTLLFRSGIRNAYGEEAGASMHRAYQEFIATMPVAVRACEDLLVVHTTPERRYLKNVTAEHFTRDPDPEDWKPRGWVEQLVWGRDFADQTADIFAREARASTFIVGHTPCKRGYRVPNHRHVIVDSKDEYGVYVLLDLSRRYTQQEVVAAIAPLTPGTAIGPQKNAKGARRAS